MNHLIEQGESLFNELSEQSIAMQLVGDNVKVYARQNTISESLLLKIRQNKEQLKEFLKSKKKLPQIKPDKEALYQPFPLTDIQRAYWVGHQMEVELADVSIHYYSEVLCASLDLVRFDEAVQKTIARHDMLRAVVDEQGSQQILANTPAYEVQFDDIRHLDDAQKTTWLGEYRNARSHSQRSPGHFPGFDFSIVRVSDAQDILYASVDLLHVDGGSLMILFNDLYRFYEDASYNPEPISISYRDYALAEASIHHSALYQQGLEYWRNEVKNLPAAPDLPQLNVASQASRFVRHQFNITPEQGAMLKRRAADLKVTPTVFVMLAFSELLRKWNSGNDFTLNVTVFNRLAMHPEVNQLIGDFTSMLLIPVSHDQDETLADKVLRLQKKLWSSMKHRHVSGVTVLNELGKYTGNQGNVQMPIVFTSMLDLGGQGIPSNWLSCFGEEQFTLTQTPQVSFDHQITQLESGEMRFSWDVIEHLFPLGMVEDMFEVYEQLVLALIEDPASWKQNSLDILPQRQLEVVAQANDSQVDFGEPCSLLDLFKTSVAAQPDATAVVSGDTHFSYAQLDLQARQLAAKIIEHNIAPGSVIAIFMEKGWEQVVAALAIHYSGCAYLPLDVEQPVQRLSYQLENSAAVAILHQDHLLSQAQTLPVAHAIAVTLQEQTECVPDEQVLLQRKPAPGDLSHLIYTSGSTGKPKGVMVEHQQVVNRMLDINQRFAIGAGDAVIALTALHHDLSVYDLFGMLAAGGTMVIPQRDLRLDPQHWLALASRHQVTVWNSVPAYLDIFLDYLDTQSQAMSADAFKMFILAGDWIPVNQPKRVHGYWPQAQFVASGGPTETTIWDIYNLVDPNETFK
ncbi:hypothetical protein C3B51_00740 [Pseudoalteromonas rubra]|uniref:Non-ribosomal peptide synthetase n=1 Tax=Pseudoalteromonas rubra TaxID=43658 RepID=A0A4Q7ENM2_9GAMM|nr:hypothetical protein C3B51_00740 [Pseudoalteromonas rubra]